jgi:hypothetical protein
MEPCNRSGMTRATIRPPSRPMLLNLTRPIEGFAKPELHSFVLGAVAPQTRLVTDDWPSYRDLPDVRHNAITLSPMAAHVALPWIHGCFQTSSAGGWASTTDCAKSTFSITSMSSCSASTGAGRLERALSLRQLISA